MAGAHCAASSSSFLNPKPTITYTTTTSQKFGLKPLLALSSISTPLSPKPNAKRKNHLRPKILKTLTKPFPIAPVPEISTTIPIIPIISPPTNDAVFDTAVNEVEEFPVSQNINTVSGEYSGSVGKFSVNSVLKFGVYLVGVLLFQTICVVWLLGSTDSRDEERNLSDLGSKAKVLVSESGNGNGNAGFITGSELKLRINEIRAMAREARERERREIENQGDEESDIEREIGARLVKLEKRLNSKRDKLQGSLMDYLGMFGNEEEEKDDGFSEDGLDSNEVHEPFIFKKRFRFRSPSMNARSGNPKGFSGLKDGGNLHRVNGSDPKMDGGRKDTNTQLNSLQNDGNKLQKELGSGAVQQTFEGTSSIKDTKSLISRDLERKNSQSLMEESQKTTIKCDESAPLTINGSSEPRRRPPANKVTDKQLDAQTDLWWLNLPYVLAILMRRGSEREGPAGLYVLRVTSDGDNLGDSSYTVAFEDRGDANNFCYLLESFFEDLGDFSADIVPLSIKELHEAVKSHSKKVIVVKKGQLKLYVGQPFAEVEMALCSLLEQN